VATSGKAAEESRRKAPVKNQHATAFKVLAVLALIALALQSVALYLALFEQPLPYSIADPGKDALDSPAFLHTLAALTGSAVYGANTLETYNKGADFYEAELAAIRGARDSIHIECYIFQAGRVTDRILQALEERAAAGVRVNLVIDAIGSNAFPKSRFERLRSLGGRVGWYHPVRWYTWPRINNRTHREIVVVDGKVGFAGGAGFSDQWMYDRGKERAWRDTMVRVEGEAVSGLQGVFAENWLESSGDMIANPRFFPWHKSAGDAVGLVVCSTPTRGRSTEARILFQALIAKASKSVHINTPYFLPDDSLKKEIAKAVRERGVEVSIIVPGTTADHALTRRSSRQSYGDLLKAGARIFEYERSMMHAKVLLVDGTWAVVGSTNMDARSFGLNDEMNMAFPDRALAARLEQDFANDLKSTREVHYDEWKRRPMNERVWEWFGWLVKNQQ
jgi:cardiolipin synthase